MEDIQNAFVSRDQASIVLTIVIFVGAFIGFFVHQQAQVLLLNGKWLNMPGYQKLAIGVAGFLAAFLAGQGMYRFGVDLPTSVEGLNNAALAILAAEWGAAWIGSEAIKRIYLGKIGNGAKNGTNGAGNRHDDK